MCEVDIRPQGKIERIRFADDGVCYDQIAQDDAPWQAELHDDDICERVTIYDAHHARMLIASLEKFIEIGMLK